MHAFQLVEPSSFHPMRMYAPPQRFLAEFSSGKKYSTLDGWLGHAM
jgi:hypothetical protein